MSTILEYLKYKIEIDIDEDPYHPRRDCDNLGTIVCISRKYDIRDTFQLHRLDVDTYDSIEDLKRDIINIHNPVVMLPVYLLDHGGINISTTPFNDRFDSGQIGFIYVTRNDVLKEYPDRKRLTKQLRDKIIHLLEQEVIEYSSYLRGDNVYRHSISLFGIEIDTAGNFGSIEEAMAAAKIDVLFHRRHMDIRRYSLYRCFT